MIRIAVCDDEQYMSDQISVMVSDFFCRKNTGKNIKNHPKHLQRCYSECNHLSIEVTQFSNGEALLESDQAFDVLFLDIQMIDMDGLETARQLRRRGFNGYLIFTTILKEMVFQSFEVQAYDYLVKPIEKKHFDKTMERLLISMQKDAEKKLLVQKGYDSSIISFDEIVYCEIIGRKIYLHLTSSEVIDFYDRIENLETRLDSRFYRCHRSYLINMKYLRGYKNGVAKMMGDIEIPVSRLRSKEFSGIILQYMKNK
ncbi:MAG: LytTR family DNA-binding domain-containing protein [Lachnospiraceae bacterium]|nr:LytTR family DNA-binding domain-containing protein [Lachnospiraceae bacterium]